MAQPSGSKLAFGIFSLLVLLGALGWFFFAAPPPARVAPSPAGESGAGAPREPPSTAAGRPPANPPAAPEGKSSSP